MPNYNRVDVIQRAIKSVLGQTYNDLELIIVDDCSTDNSFDIISSIEDERVKVYKLERNSGAATARNFGIKKSSGEFISFLDSDDYFEPEFLETSYEVLSKSDSSVGFMWTGIRYHFRDKTIEMRWNPKIRKNAYITFLYEHKIGTGSGITLKRTVFEKCGLFNEKLRAAEDTEFFLRITQVFNFANTNKILVNVYKTQQDRLSRDYKNLGLAYNIFIKNHLEEIEKDKNLQTRYFYKLMWLNYNMKDKQKGRYYFRKIPFTGISFYLKSFLLFTLYESLNSNTAKKIHNKIFKVIQAYKKKSPNSLETKILSK